MDVHFPDGVTLESVSRSAHLVFDEKDLLPQQWVTNAFGTMAMLVGHRIPSFSGYMSCCLNGSGWGMMPRGSVEKSLDSGALVELLPGAVVVVPLFWQAAAPSSEIMRILSSIVRETAGKHLGVSDQGLHEPPRARSAART
jgi:LysR family transcriptional regulator, chromosome initiation inhibitor